MELASPNAPVQLFISSIRRVLLEDAPSMVQNTTADLQREAAHNPATNTLVKSYFSCNNDMTVDQIMGVAMTIFKVDEERLKFMANSLMLAVQSAFGERYIHMDAPTIRK